MIMKQNINPDNSLLLLVDIQEKFRKVIPNLDEVISNSAKLIKSFNILKIPIIVTEQYPQGLGGTVQELKELLEEHDHIEKISFDCFRNQDFIKKLKEKNKQNLIICGIETHICVTQTVLSALENKFNVYLIADAVSSRKKTDYEISLKKMQAEGAKLASTEMIIFQMMKDSKDNNFKEISNIVK